MISIIIILSGIYLTRKSNTYVCIVGENIPIHSNTNYRREIKLMIVDVDYCLL